jgi:hypothetical protein
LLEACHSGAQVGLGAVECRQAHLLELESKVSSTRRYFVALLFCVLGQVGVAMDSMCLLGVSRIVTWWFIFRFHQDGSLVVVDSEIPST